jgi:hypothetical protein
LAERWPGVFRALERKAETQFKPGVCPNPTGRAGKQVRTETNEPVKRDFKAENANSTVGKLAAAGSINTADPSEKRAYGQRVSNRAGT